MGLEPVLLRELEALGASNIQPMVRGASFEGDLKMLYRANLELRTAIRILKPFWRFRARDEQELYHEIQRINWTKHLTLKHTFAIDAVAHSRFFKHSKYAALKTKDAIVDQFRDRFEDRPNVTLICASMSTFTRMKWIWLTTAAATPCTCVATVGKWAKRLSTRCWRQV
jgi:putative N6-adenine-specific DNA methylase